MNKHLEISSLGAPQSTDNAATICRRLAGYDFPWELNRSLEIAILKTFCIPRISQLLHQTGEFEKRPQKRYDDTSLIIGNLVKWGYDSPRGKKAIAQMNRIHKRFPINNDDFLYVLSTFIYEPIRWNQHFGWRLFTPQEKQALFQFWTTVGGQMEIQGIPDTYEALEAFNQRYEEENFEYHEDNVAIGNAVVSLMQGWLPAIAAPLIPTVVRSLSTDAMCRAMGWERPSALTTHVVLGSLKQSRKLAKRLPRRRNPNFLVDNPNTTYPDGYTLENLGPDAPEVPKSASRCPFMKMRSLLRVNA